MQTAQQYQMFDRTANAVSPATCIETLYFEQQYNGQVYRTSLNNRLLVVGNKLNSVSKTSITESLNQAQIPFYYITKIKSDTASGLYRLDVSLYSINNAVKATAVINDLSTRIYEEDAKLKDLILDVSTEFYEYKTYVDGNYLNLKGGTMSGGIAFSKKTDKELTSSPGILSNGDNLILACPNGYISLWGALSEEYNMNNAGVTINKPTTQENGKVLVYNHASQQLVWSMYNAGSLSYSTADYSKYYILGITQQSYEERDFGEESYIATEGNIETNVYVHRKNVYANAFYASSDIALKYDVQPIDVSTYIPDVIQFRWYDTSELSYGFIAQDLEEHGLQYLMDKDDDDHWRVNYNAALALVVGDLQQKYKKQEQELKEHKQQISELKAYNKSLEDRITKLEKLIK